jgi:hypothetical protein
LEEVAEAQWHVETGQKKGTVVIAVEQAFWRPLRSPVCNQQALGVQAPSRAYSFSPPHLAPKSPHQSPYDVMTPHQIDLYIYGEPTTMIERKEITMKAKEKTNPNKTARLAGLLYFIVAPFAAFGMMYATSLIVPGDAAATASNIKASESIFRLSILGALIGQVGHIWLVTVLYKLLKPVNKNHAVLMVVFMLVGVPISMLSELSRFAVLLLLSGADYLAVFTADQLQALVPLFLDLRDAGVSIAYVFWGLWLLPMGILVFKSDYIPKILGVLLIIGCAGYLIDFFTFALFPGIEPIGGLTAIGEFPIFPLWLLIKGVNVEQWEKCTEAV